MPAGPQVIAAFNAAHFLGCAELLENAELLIKKAAFTKAPLQLEEWLLGRRLQAADVGACLKRDQRFALADLGSGAIIGGAAYRPYAFPSPEDARRAGLTLAYEVLPFDEAHSLRACTDPEVADALLTCGADVVARAMREVEAKGPAVSRLKHYCSNLRIAREDDVRIAQEKVMPILISNEETLSALRAMVHMLTHYDEQSVQRYGAQHYRELTQNWPADSFEDCLVAAIQRHKWETSRLWHDHQDVRIWAAAREELDKVNAWIDRACACNGQLMDSMCPERRRIYSMHTALCQGGVSAWAVRLAICEAAHGTAGCTLATLVEMSCVPLARRGQPTRKRTRTQAA